MDGIKNPECYEGKRILVDGQSQVDPIQLSSTVGPNVEMTSELQKKKKKKKLRSRMKHKHVKLYNYAFSWTHEKIDVWPWEDVRTFFPWSFHELNSQNLVRKFSSSRQRFGVWPGPMSFPGAIFVNFSIVCFVRENTSFSGAVGRPARSSCSPLPSTLWHSNEHTPIN